MGIIVIGLALMIQVPAEIVTDQRGIAELLGTKRRG